MIAACAGMTWPMAVVIAVAFVAICVLVMFAIAASIYDRKPKGSTK